MSSTKSAPLLTLDLVPSRLLIGGLAGCHALASLSLCFVNLPLGIRALLALAIIGSASMNYLRYGSARSRWFIERLTRSVQGTWTLYTADGTEIPVHLINSYVHPRLVVLRFTEVRFARHAVVVLPDSADPDQIRRLRVQLLTAKHADGAALLPTIDR